MPQCAPSITTAFSPASRAAPSLLPFRLLALLGLKGTFVCPCRRCDIDCRYVLGVEGCKVGSFPPPDELAGICTGWITRQRESIIQKKERKRHACGPRVPFPIQGTIFPKCGGLEKRISLGGARVGQWGVGAEVIYVYAPHLFSTLAPSWSDPGVKMQNTIMGPSGRTNATFMMDECGI